jgi:hypothetical protein
MVSWLVNDEFRRIWMDAVVAQYKVLAQRLPWGPETNHEIPRSDLKTGPPEYKTGLFISRTRNSATLFDEYRWADHNKEEEMGRICSTHGDILGVKQPERDVEHWPPSSSDLKICGAINHTSTSPYALMSLFCVKLVDNLTIILWASIWKRYHAPFDDTIPLQELS